MEEKNTLVTRSSACFQMLDFGTSKPNSEVSKSNSNILVANYSFLENSWEPFLKMFYTTNSSPLLLIN